MNPSCTLLVLAGLSAGGFLGRAAQPAPFDPRTAQVFAGAMTFGDRSWDERANLLSAADGHDGGGRRVHLIRESGWYALGLLMRAAPGDAARAQRIVAAVLDQQIHAPGRAWDGTFHRTPEEPEVPFNGAIWTDYDPNWRQFIGTTFALDLENYGGQLPADLRARMIAAIGRAAEGELHDGRLRPTYTNISLMHAFLCAYAGAHLGRSDLAAVGHDYTEAVYQGFKEHGTFEEYNSPTYCGVDLYGLALWRKLGPSERMRTAGADMEAALWRDLASFYNANLQNLSGPYDRTYGMDMRRYVSLTGLWLRLNLDEAVAPFPPLNGPMEHPLDYLFTPLFSLLGTRIPPDALKEFQGFSGERRVTRTLPGDRTATAWIGKGVLIGAEATRASRGVLPGSQFHPATIHWRTPAGVIGWLAVTGSSRIDATAGKDSLAIVAVGDLVVHVSAPGTKIADFARDRWALPGLSLLVRSDAATFSVTPTPDGADVNFREGVRLEISVIP